MTSSPATESALKACPFCNAGKTVVEERRMPPTMKGPGAVISATVRHWCPAPEGQPTGMHVSMHGRDREAAIAAWNRRPPVSSPVGEGNNNSVASPSQCESRDLLLALADLEKANDDLCALRTQPIYDAMIEAGHEGALEALDAARRQARAVLASPPTGAWRDIATADLSTNVDTAAMSTNVDTVRSEALEEAIKAMRGMRDVIADAPSETWGVDGMGGEEAHLQTWWPKQAEYLHYADKAIEAAERALKEGK